LNRKKANKPSASFTDWRAGRNPRDGESNQASSRTWKTRTQWSMCRQLAKPASVTSSSGHRDAVRVIVMVCHRRDISITPCLLRVMIDGIWGIISSTQGTSAYCCLICSRAKTFTPFQYRCSTGRPDPPVARSGRTGLARYGPHRATGRTGPNHTGLRAATSAHGPVRGPFWRATGHSGRVFTGPGRPGVAGVAPLLAAARASSSKLHGHICILGQIRRAKLHYIRALWAGPNYMLIIYILGQIRRATTGPVGPADRAGTGPQAEAVAHARPYTGPG
jgi:hypothetical protein